MEKTKRKAPLTQEAYNLLREKIMKLQYRPGEILLVQQLANETDFSRTPIREALIKLTADGFVEPYSGGKYRVKKITIETIRELCDIRRALECLSAEAIVDSITDGQIAYMDELINLSMQVETRNDYQLMAECDLKLHGYIMELYGNATLIGIMQQISDRIQYVRYLIQGVPGRFQTTIEEHRAIVQAFREHNPQKVRDCISYHIDSVSTIMQRFLKERPEDSIGRIYYSIL